MEALKYVDVISPNLEEFAALFDVEIDLDRDSGRNILERKCKEILTLGFGCKPSAVVVRLGERGCYCAQFSRGTFFPAFHELPSESDVENVQNEEIEHDWKKQKLQRRKVVDPTGGGNAFLGGFCVGLLTEPHPEGLTEFEVGCIYGSVAASFAIEQVGMPKLSYTESDDKELWNGERVGDRMSEFQNRLDVPPLTKEQLRKASLYEPALNGNYDESIIRKNRPVVGL